MLIRKAKTEDIAAVGQIYEDIHTEEEAGPVVRQVLEREPDLDVGSALRAALKALGKAR